MASSSESAEKGEVGPAEDVVHAFMEFLVDPRLPSRLSAKDPPSEDAERSIARQMHSVVLLYNYYHRRQKPEFEFLDFVSFCKLAVLLRPSLIAFIRNMNVSEAMELDGAECQLSVTEKAIKDACDIALALDASVDVPQTEGWPITKIAVLLIDKSNQNCRLQFGAITEGVWSTYEKETNKSYTVSEDSAENKVVNGKKRKRNADSELLQIGYDVVKDVTGIGSSDLVVAGTHVTYSLSKEKSATRAYLIQCPLTFGPKEQVPIEFLVKSLRGPLVEKAFGSWSTTPVVEYHHMLPYVGFISCWLSGEDLCLPRLSGYNAQNTTNSCEKELTQSRIFASPVSSCNWEDLDYIRNNRSEEKTESCDKIANYNSDNKSKNRKQSSGEELATAVSIVECPENQGDVTEKVNQRYNILTSVVKDNSKFICLANFSKETNEDATNIICLANLDKETNEEKNESCDKIANHNSYKNSKKDKISSGGKAATAINVVGSPENHGDVRDKFSQRCGIMTSVVKDSSIICQGNLEETNESESFYQMVNNYSIMEKSHKRSDTVDSARKKERNKVGNLDTESEDLHKNFTGPSGSSPKTFIDGSVTKKLRRTCDITGSVENEEIRICPENLDKERDETQKVDSLSDPMRGLKTTNMSELSRTFPNSEGANKKLNLKMRVYQHRRKSISSTQHDVHGLNETANWAVGVVDSVKSHECRDEKVSEGNGDFTISCDREGAAVTDKGLSPFEVVSKNNIGVQCVTASDELRNALALLYGKREELFSQICSMEDELAVYEDNIEKIRDDGDIGLARQCIENIISGNNHLMLKHKSHFQDEVHQPNEVHSKSLREKPIPLYNTLLPGKSSRQDLEYICLKNNWRLPRYFIEPANGKFLSNVVVGRKDFKLSSKGDLESNPIVARESVAAQMIAKIRNLTEVDPNLNSLNSP